MVGRGWVSWLLAGVVTSLLVASCGDDTDNAHQPPLMTDGGGGNAAAGEGADRAGNANGTGHGMGGDHAGQADAASGNAGEGLGGSGGESAAQGGAGPVTTEPITLGLHCERDADCGLGLKCLGADQDYPDGTGAPPRGLCTLECTHDSDCRGFDPTAVCATLDEMPIMLAAAEEPAPRLCMQGCTFGTPSGSGKCHGQLDMACRPFAVAPLATCFQQDDVCPDGTFCFRGACREAACGPRCNTNADCSPGRSCNASTGLCEEGELPAVPVGVDCPGDQDPDSTVCGYGTCLLLSAEGANVKRMCTQTCTIGTLCAENGACVLPRLDPYAAGDIGYCMERCNCDADCSHPDDKCYEWETPLLADRFQSRGICDTADPAYETLTTCEDAGGAGGAGGMGNAGQGGQPH
ncbi:MAG TPA: hypothetical protein VHB79_17635 [Polyangiaceae bacterium]|nr:hypothetical protein [Polyangiaceae bacterium]